MKIIIFSTTYIPYIGGAEIAIREITDRISDIEFHLFTPRYSLKQTKGETIGNVIVHRFGFGLTIDKYLFALFGGFFAKRLHGEQSFDGAWCMEANYAGFAAEQFGRMTGVNYLLSLQQGDPLERIEAKGKKLHKRFVNIFRNATVIQSISSYLREWGQRQGFRGESVIIPNGVDIGRFTRVFTPEERMAIRMPFGFPENAVVMVTASRLVRKNAIGDVIEAMPAMDERVCFVICGEGILGSVIRARVSELGLESRVRFVGEVSHDELPKILKSCDMFIRPSLSEGLGNAFIEAMAAELITIGTPVGGIVDFLADGVNGFLVEPRRPESIARQIERIMSLSDEEKKRITKNGRSTVEQGFDWNRIAVDMHGLFEKTCNTKHLV